MESFKKRWNITSNLQLIVIFVVFAITGSSAALLAKPFLHFIGISKIDTHWVLYYFLYVVLIFPIYQILLVFFGFLFGQIAFFWSFEIKMLRSLKLNYLANYLEKIKKF